MSLFGAALADHLAETLNISVSDATDSLNSFLSPDEIEHFPNKNGKKVPTKSNAKVPEKKEVKKPAAKNTKEVPVKGKPAEKHTCARIKRGQADPCGKNATKFIGTGKQQKWFCGTEKAGCYLAELNAEAKKNIDKKAIDANVSKTKSSTQNNTKNSTAVSKKTNEERKVISDNKSKSLVRDILGKLDVNKRTIGGKVLYIERTKRLLYDFETKEFYGMLDEDNKTVLPIPDDLVKWVESHGQYVKQDPNIKLQSKHKSRDTKATPQKADVKEEKKVTSTKTNDKKKVEVVVSEDEEEDPELEDDEDPELDGNDDVEISSADKDDALVESDDLELLDDDEEISSAESDDQ
jgi:hypothetical protein